MEIVGVVPDIKKIYTFAYSIKARENLVKGEWHTFTGTITQYEPLALQFFQADVDTYFQHMDYNYKLTERVECYGVDEEGNRINLEPMVIHERYFWLNKKEVVRDED